LVVRIISGISEILEVSTAKRRSVDDRRKPPDIRQLFIKERQKGDATKPAPGSQQAASIRQQTADLREQTADSRQQIADTRQQTANSRQQTADTSSKKGREAMPL
jgi:hypothetical protein